MRKSKRKGEKLWRITETVYSKFHEWVQVGVLTLYTMSVENVSKFEERYVSILLTIPDVIL